MAFLLARLRLAVCRKAGSVPDIFHRIFKVLPE
jgi:hypothetical protein